MLAIRKCAMCHRQFEEQVGIPRTLCKVCEHGDFNENVISQTQSPYPSNIKGDAWYEEEYLQYERMADRILHDKSKEGSVTNDDLMMEKIEEEIGGIDDISQIELQIQPQKKTPQNHKKRKPNEKRTPHDENVKKQTVNLYKALFDMDNKENDDGHCNV